MAERVRVLFVNEGALGGGAVLGHARVAQTLERSLASEALDVAFAMLPPMPAFARAAVRQVPGLGHLDLDLQTSRWHLAQALRARRVVRAAIARGPTGVLHLNGHTLSFLLGDVMRRVPTLLSVDSTVSDWHAMGIWRTVRPYSRAAIAPSLALERRAFARAARVLAWTGWAARSVARACPQARVIEHHPGIDLETFAPAPRPDGEPLRVLFVGGRFAEKGGHDLLEALSDDLGRGVELDAVTPAELAPRPGLRVHRLMPADPRLPALYRRADVFCLPTRGDAVPLSVVEAMACGAAVVATPVGAIPDLLAGEQAGRLVPARDPRALRAAILALGRDRAAREALGAAGRALCEARFDARVQARQLAQLAREVAAGRA